jgi:hypothetical protein
VPEHVHRNIARVRAAEISRQKTGGTLPTATFVSGRKVSLSDFGRIPKENSMNKFGYLILLIFMHAGASAVPTTQSSAWTQQELNERFMRSMSKDQCMAKTVASLKTGCQSNECLKTLAGITGDCITWAKGDSKEFCEAYTQNYLGRYCASKELDARSCMLLHIAKSSSPCHDQKQ